MVNFVRRMKAQKSTRFEDISEVALAEASQSQSSSSGGNSYLKYRQNAIKSSSGKKATLPSEDKIEKERELLGKRNAVENPYVATFTEGVEMRNMIEEQATSKMMETIVRFKTTKYAVMESVGTMRVHLEREGNLAKETIVTVNTEDGTATAADNDYGAH